MATPPVQMSGRRHTRDSGPRGDGVGGSLDGGKDAKRAVGGVVSLDALPTAHQQKSDANAAVINNLKCGP
jgi:hypothetical protein